MIEIKNKAFCEVAIEVFQDWQRKNLEAANTDEDRKIIREMTVGEWIMHQVKSPIYKQKSIIDTAVSTDGKRE